MLGNMAHTNGMVVLPTRFINGPKSGIVSAQKSIAPSTHERITTRVKPNAAIQRCERYENARVP